MHSLSDTIRGKAIALGFDLVGFAPAGPAPHADSLSEWLAAGYHADMLWLARNRDRRSDPRLVVPDARSAVLVGLSYYVEDPPASIWDDPLRGRVARYAWGPDYHEELLPRLLELKAFIEREGTGTTAGTGTPRCRAYVDTGPLMERSWAAKAGLGFIGKNTLLISPKLGSYLYLGGIVTDLELEYDESAEEYDASLGTGTCGECKRCLGTCPSHAFPAPYILDSNRCISYLTIELKTSIPAKMRPLMGPWIFGCDACQEVCPWVRQYARPSDNRFLVFDAERFAPDLMELMTLDEDGFRQRYKGTPIKRAKRRGLLRNAAVALGNSGKKEALPVLRQAAEDHEPLVREHAEWAIGVIEGRCAVSPDP